MSAHADEVVAKEIALSDYTPGLRYGVAVAATLAALVGRAILEPWMGTQAPNVLFSIAVIAAARIGGPGPGLAATALIALSARFLFLEPRYSLTIVSPEVGARVVLLIAVGASISLLVGRLRQALVTTARAEERLRRKQQLVDLSHDAIITADLDRRITGWNAGATAMYGWTESEALGKIVHDLLNSSRAVSTCKIDEILRREGRWDAELSQLTRDGRQLVVESRTVMLRDGQNHPVGILEINRDVTDRRRAQEESRRAGEQRLLALECANMGTWVRKVPSSQVLWDTRCANIWGDPAGREITYDEIIARIHPEDRAMIDGVVKEAITDPSKETYDQEYRVVWPDGSVHWVAAHGRLFVEGDGDQRRVVQFAGVSTEITQRKQAEERLQQAQKLESIGVLAGGIAHDFNNLLTVIMGSASSALADCPSCEYSQAILTAAEEAAFLTGQLLAYAGKGQGVRKLVDLTDLVSESKAILSASIPKRVDLKFDLSEELPCIEGDPSRIEQVLMNLVINAGEAIAPKTGGFIEIVTRRGEITPEMALQHSRSYQVAVGPCACLEVRDSGDGMDEATISRIFDPFFTTKFTGRGLGLAAVHGIVRSSKGVIDVQSSRGGGTTFRVFLPASAMTFRAAPVLKPPERESRDNATILVVEDEEMVRKLACLTLRGCGYDVLQASNGKDALQVLADSATLPSLALLDLTMPVMGGEELAPILGKKYPNLKIVVSSGYTDEEALQGFMSVPVAGFLRKPYTPDALAEKVEAALEVKW